MPNLRSVKRRDSKEGKWSRNYDDEGGYADVWTGSKFGYDPKEKHYTAGGEEVGGKDWSGELAKSRAGEATDPEFDKWMQKKGTGLGNEARRKANLEETNAINKGYKDPETGKVIKMPARPEATAGQPTRRPTPKDREGFKQRFIETKLDGEHPKDINPREEAAAAKADLPSYFDHVSQQLNWGKVYDDMEDLPTDQKAVWKDLAGRFVQKAQFEADTRKKENTKRLYDSLKMFDKTVADDQKRMSAYKKMIDDVTERIEEKKKPLSSKEKRPLNKRLTTLVKMRADLMETAEEELDEKGVPTGNLKLSADNGTLLDQIDAEMKEIKAELGINTEEAEVVTEGQERAGALQSTYDLPEDEARAAQSELFERSKPGATGETTSPSPDQEAMRIGAGIKARIPNISQDELAQAIRVEMGGAAPDTPESATPGVTDATNRVASEAVAEPEVKKIDGTDDSLRPDGTKKGNGFLGPLKRPDGKVSTELSIGVEINGKEIDIPTLIPGLTDDEIEFLLNMNEGDASKIPESIVRKAVTHARKRIKAGLSPFADENESKKTASEKRLEKTKQYQSENIKKVKKYPGKLRDAIRKKDDRYKKVEEMHGG